ncbi:hypothetical protein GCM10018787_34060 [Streptomyces thermodiastaticus]|nr:hypothetical protein GCM10018787_34060 [Streptomyces thermodiastaticus]
MRHGAPGARVRGWVHRIHAGRHRTDLDNLLRMIFLDPYAQEFYADRDTAAHIAVANLRARGASQRRKPS